MGDESLLGLARAIIERSERGVGLWIRPDGTPIQLSGRADGAVELAAFAVSFAAVYAEFIRPGEDNATLRRLAAMLGIVIGSGVPLSQPQSAATTT